MVLAWILGGGVGVLNHKKTTRNRSMVALCLIGAALSACQVNPPMPGSSAWLKANFPERYAENGDPAHGGVSAQFDQNTPWWQQFHDAQLTALVERAAQHNFDVDLALERVNLARAGARSAGANLGPTLSLSGGQNDSSARYSEAVKAGDLLPDKRVTQVGLNASWDFDIFGATRAGKLAAEKDVRAGIWGVYGAQLIVSQETASQYFLYQSLLARKALFEALITSQQDSLAAARKRREAGVSGEIEIDQFEINLANVQASLREIDAALQTTHHQIALLTVTPIDQLKITANPALFDQTILTQKIPTGLPVDLLTRRPDIRAAEYQLAAESARLVQSERNRLPKTVASLVWGAQDLVFSPASPLALTPVAFLNTALSFALPLYDPRIKAAIEGQSAKEKTALIQYHKTVFNALTQVENSLTARQQQQQRYADLNTITQKYQNAYQHTQRMFDAGLTNRIKLQEANRGQLVAQLNLIDAEIAQANAMIGLYTALGGSWSPRADQGFPASQLQDKTNSPLLQPDAASKGSRATLSKSATQPESSTSRLTAAAQPAALEAHR